MFHWPSFLTYCVVASYTPGPNNIMCMSKASQAGLKKSLPFVGGVLCGVTVVMLLCALFSSLLFRYLPAIRMYMQILGAAYMLWLAWKILRHHPGLEGKNGRSNGFLAGVLLQFVNAKMYIYAITALSSYVLPWHTGRAAVVGFTLLMALIGCSANVSWAVFGSVFKKLFTRYGRQVNVVMALLLVYCAVSLFL